MKKLHLKSRDPAAAGVAELKRQFGIAERHADRGKPRAPASQFDPSYDEIFLEDRAERRRHILLRGIIIGLALVICISLLAAIID